MSKDNHIGTHKTTVRTVGDRTSVVYHVTEVVSFSDKQIALCNGGWRTPTTKLRMNQTSNVFNLGYKVFQKDNGWFVTYKGKTESFYEPRHIIIR